MSIPFIRGLQNREYAFFVKLTQKSVSRLSHMVYWPDEAGGGEAAQHAAAHVDSVPRQPGHRHLAQQRTHRYSWHRKHSVISDHGPVKCGGDCPSLCPKFASLGGDLDLRGSEALIYCLSYPRHWVSRRWWRCQSRGTRCWPRTWRCRPCPLWSGRA